MHLWTNSTQLWRRFKVLSPLPCKVSGLIFWSSFIIWNGFQHILMKYYGLKWNVKTFHFVNENFYFNLQNSIQTKLDLFYNFLFKITFSVFCSCVWIYKESRHKYRRFFFLNPALWDSSPPPNLPYLVSLLLILSNYWIGCIPNAN